MLRANLTTLSTATRCRRRDVVDVFLGTGLGPRSYSVIQQGMIGRIVDSSPQQLREFIEEAAGVSRYQARREETQKKLLKTQENLERLHDIEAELSRQKKKLVKQAESANQYQQIQEQLATVKAQLAIHQLCQAKSLQMQHKSSEESLTNSVTTLQQQYSHLKAKFSKLSDRLAEEQWLKDEARDKLHVQDMQRQQAEHQLHTLQANINQLEGRQQANIERQKRAENSLIEAEKEQQQQAEIIGSITPKITELEQRQQQNQQAYAPLQSRWNEVNAEVIELEKQKRHFEQQLALDEQANSRVEQDLSKWQSQQELWQQEAVKWGLAPSESNFDKDSDDLQDNPVQALTELKTKLSGLMKQQETVTESLETEQPILNELSQQLTAKQTQLAQLEKQHASLIAEYETLHSIVHPKKSNIKDDQPQQGKANPQSINTAVATLSKLPVLHQQIRLTSAGEQHASVLDRWLAFWLDSRVMDITSAKDKAQAGEWYQVLSELTALDADLTANQRRTKSKAE